MPIRSGAGLHLGHEVHASCCCCQIFFNAVPQTHAGAALTCTAALTPSTCSCSSSNSNNSLFYALSCTFLLTAQPAAAVCTYLAWGPSRQYSRHTRGSLQPRHINGPSIHEHHCQCCLWRTLGKGHGDIQLPACARCKAVAGISMWLLPAGAQMSMCSCAVEIVQQCTTCASVARSPA